MASLKDLWPVDGLLFFFLNFKFKKKVKRSFLIYSLIRKIRI